MSHFFDEGVRDVERRLPFIRPLTRADERAAIALAESSVLVGAVDWLVTRACRVWESSGLVAHSQRMWREVPAAVRLPAIGLALIVAAPVHLGLVVAHERPAGWLWLILPAFAAATGSLMIVFGRSRRFSTPVD